MKRKDVTKLILSPRHCGSFSYGVAILGILREGLSALVFSEDEKEKRNKVDLEPQAPW